MLPYKSCEVGDSIKEIDTPALVLDLDTFERNLDLLMHSAGTMRVRPHAKSHKCPEIAKRQMARGAVGICCQTLSEAMVFAKAGIGDILITNEIVGQKKLAHLAGLSQSCQLGVLVDDAMQIQALGQAMAGQQRRIDVYVEVEVGGQRCGAMPVEVPALVSSILGHASLRFAGLHAYNGGAQHLRTPEQRQMAIGQTVQTVRGVISSLEKSGVSVPCITGAGTGTFWLERDSGFYTEIQPGSYALMDRDYADNTSASGDVGFEHALFIQTSVMSVTHRESSKNSTQACHHGFVVVDAGLKSMSMDSGLPVVYDRPELVYRKASDEHGVVGLSQNISLSLDDKLWLVPGHCDPTVNLYDELVIVSNGRVVDLWQISARGATL